MKIGIWGSGNVGKTLAKGLAVSGHRVVVSSREPDHPKHASWKKETGSSVGMVTFDEAARFGETMILALPWNGLKDVLESIDPACLKIKPSSTSAMPYPLTAGRVCSITKHLLGKSSNSCCLTVLSLKHSISSAIKSWFTRILTKAPRSCLCPATTWSPRSKSGLC
ncbi:NADPH-dependent F420 reductase [Paenibacillus sp. AR247]|uniref:NADPH-dependent F420 reductase n=1 Tax=Paenibacillus sp. AR247 TaxID=1631599 RepID=UPI000CF8D6B8|nr:NAD(P)-binding domain-containing protein [Paenibacillus sp. AR247]PQP87021.1 hypothetical protein CPT76_25770 [Paenibacillus sp. AR247]